MSNLLGLVLSRFSYLYNFYPYSIFVVRILLHTTKKKNHLHEAVVNVVFQFIGLIEPQLLLDR